MDLSVVLAAIRGNVLERVEQGLREIDVRGISVSKVKGYGEYHNFFARDYMVESVRLEIFTRTDKVDAITPAHVRRSCRVPVAAPASRRTRGSDGRA
jgi:nitrogen regulatory protein P-II 1